MNTFDVAMGLKFHDDGLQSQPPEYRVHVIEAVEDKRFHAVHVASGNTRAFASTPEGVANLRPIANHPSMAANLDSLVGERVKVDLKQGSSLTGKVTAVRYGTVDIAGFLLEYVRELELDKSGVSSYPMVEIDSIQIVR